MDALPRYQHVTVRGHFDPARQVLLDNMPSSAGQAGYRVLTPFVRPGSAKLLLVDRGWVPLGLSRDKLPDVTVTGEPRETGGRLDQLPVPGVRIGAADVPGDRHWPRVLFFPRVADLEQALQAPGRVAHRAARRGPSRTATSASGALPSSFRPSGTSATLCSGSRSPSSPSSSSSR